MMSNMHSQINRAITTAIAERVIPDIQNIANSMSSTGHRDNEASMSPNSQKNKENASRPKIKIAKKDTRSVGDFRDTTGCGSYTWHFVLCKPTYAISTVGIPTAYNFNSLLFKLSKIFT